MNDTKTRFMTKHTIRYGRPEKYMYVWKRLQFHHNTQVSCPKIAEYGKRSFKSNKWCVCLYYSLWYWESKFLCFLFQGILESNEKELVHGTNDVLAMFWFTISSLSHSSPISLRHCHKYYYLWCFVRFFVTETCQVLFFYFYVLFLIFFKAMLIM